MVGKPTGSTENNTGADVGDRGGRSDGSISGGLLIGRKAVGGAEVGTDHGRVIKSEACSQIYRENEVSRES